MLKKIALSLVICSPLVAMDFACEQEKDQESNYYKKLYLHFNTMIPNDDSAQEIFNCIFHNPKIKNNHEKVSVLLDIAVERNLKIELLNYPNQENKDIIIFKRYVFINEWLPKILALEEKQNFHELIFIYKQIISRDIFWPNKDQFEQAREILNNYENNNKNNTSNNSKKIFAIMRDLLINNYSQVK
jgi:hypothetical protein